MANTPESHFSRRTLAKGAAWSVPAVAVAAAAPSVAASELNTDPVIVSATRTGCASASLTYNGISGQEYRIEGSINESDWLSTTTSTHISTGTGSSAAVSFDSNIRYVRIQHISGTSNSGWDQEDLGAIPDATLIDSVTVTRSAMSAYTVTVSPGQDYATYEYQTTENNGNWNAAQTGTAYATPFTFQGTVGIKQIRVRRSVCGGTPTDWTTVAVPAGGWQSTTDSGRQPLDTTTETVAREASITDSQPAETTAPAKRTAEPKAPAAKKSAEPKAPAANKSAPTAKPTASPTPEPSASMVPDPEPIVTESNVLPEPVPAPTASA